MKILTEDFLERDTISLAHDLLGKFIVVGDKVGRIVETEAYLHDDPASHSFSGRTERNSPMFGSAGKSYIYFTYGMHHCFNIVSEKEDCGEAVLIRAVEPIEGIEEMKIARGMNEIMNLTNGPAKFCQAFGIDKSYNCVNLFDKDSEIILMEKEEEDFDVVTTTRVGIMKGIDLPYRFYIKGNRFVSRK